MSSLHLVFTAPWILGFLVALPLLWWFLRLMPPSPRKIIFPALALLRGLATSEQTPARTPWWLLLLRLIIVSLVIAAFAGPLLDPQTPVPGAGAVLIAVDNDWAAARAWDKRQDALHTLIEQAERENRDVILLPTAPPASGEVMQLIGPMAAREAYSYARHLAPLPWPADWKTANKLLAGFDRSSIADAFWLNDGLGGGDATTFSATLKAIGTLMGTRVLGDPETPVYTLAPPKEAGDSTAIIRRADSDPAASVTVIARGGQGQALARGTATFTAGAPQVSLTLDMPIDVHNEVTRLEIESQRTAAATLLLDEDWQHRPVGLLGDQSEATEHSLLSGFFYIDRALKPFADMHFGTLDNFLPQNMSVLVATDTTPLAAQDIAALIDWIKKGGVFLRFAGDRLAASQNPHEMELLPVTLRTGDRAMGGTMSWASPQKLRAFPASSPFQGLVIPPDVTVSRQILAEPASDLAQKTWAELEDGTPLVTAKRIGSGWSILFHVPARSDWSNLPLSGLFVDMLRRIVSLSHAGNAVGNNFSSLAPQQMLDAFGDEQAPGLTVQPLKSADFSTVEVGPAHPPGTYGNEGFRHALNLGAALGQPQALRGVDTESYQLTRSEIDLQPYLLIAALILLLMDFIVSLYLRGIVGAPGLVRQTGKIALVIFLTGFMAHAVQADDDKAAIELTSKTYLAYVKTGSAEIDRVSQAGLQGLAHILQRRTSIDQVGVAGVDPESDELVFFPLLYWPLSPVEQPLSPKAAARVSDYLRHGGMILFDSGQAENTPMTLVFQKLLGGVDIPPLVHIPDNHVLRRSFYLLDEFPGRNSGSDLWLEPESMATFDGVAAVLAGDANWAGAWAVGDNGQPLFPCTPGGEAQREMAYRFGVNIVMYALTGNYKSDQMHAQALLERLGK